MNSKVTSLAVVLGLAVLVAPALSQWQTAGTGIEYQHFTLSDPNHVFVARMDRSNAAATLESTVANGTVKGARETVRNQAARYDGSINWWGESWGQRSDVVVAINGDFFNGSTGVITGGQVQAGCYVKRFADFGGYSGFGWTLDRVPFFGGCVYHRPADQFITYASSGNTQTFQAINVSRGSDQLVIYTPQYDSNTGTNSSGSEVLVEMMQPTGLLSSPNYSSGIIRQIRQNAGSTYIPFDHIVLSATGSAATTLLNNASVGGVIRVSQEIRDYNEPDPSGDNGCASLTGLSWERTYCSIGQNYRFLENGVVRPPDPAHSGYAGLIIDDPRTAIAYNANYVFYIVVDGRSTSSIGMTMTDLGNFCKNTLGATDGANLDGGGSSTMVINGAVVNTPSDGSERTVANGMLMVNIAPKVQSTTFAVGQIVTTAASTSLRLGPGTNYAAVTSLAAAAQGTVINHSLQGVFAKGYYWWKADFSGTVGWVAESMLVGGSGPPTITQQPSAANVCPGSTVTFTVAAAGTGTLAYQWQKDQANLVDAGHYSGATTTTLTVTGADSGDVGYYRCVVSNSSGGVNSDEVALTVAGGIGSEYIVESRAGGLNFPAYSETGTWASSTAKSTAAGLTTTIGSRYCTIGASAATAVFHFTCCADGTYEVFTTNCNTSNSGNPLIHKVAHAGGTATLSVCQNSTCTSNAINKWYSLGQYILNAGIEYTVTLDGSTGAGSSPSGNAGRADAIKWVLVSQPAGPTITLQPTAQSTCAGGSATFTIAATGSGTLAYQWQKAQADLSDGGHYSGVTTAALTVSNADSGDVASYRCVVTDSNGSANSNEAALTLASGIPTTPTDGTPTADAADKITWKWTDVSDESGYRVKDTGGTNKSGNLSASTVQWQETGLAANTSYARKVYAFNGCGESAGSTGQTKYTLTSSPTYGTGTTSPTVSCDKGASNAGLIANSNVTFTATNGFGAGAAKVGQFGCVWDQVAGNPSTWTGEQYWTAGTLVRQVGTSGSWYLHLRSYNSDSPMAVNTAVLNLGPYTIGTPIPDAPAASASTGVGTDTITWNWSNVSSESGYKLYDAAGGGTLKQTLGADVTSWTETGLESNTSYGRWVTAYNGSGESARTPLGPTTTAARSCPENADFDSGFTSGVGNHWIKGGTSGTFAQETTIQRDGTSSQKITDASGGDTFTSPIYQKLDVQANRSYAVRVYHRREVSTGAVVKVGINYTGGTTEDTSGQGNGSAGVWTLKTVNFTSGATGKITVLLSAGYNGGNGSVYVDGVYLVPQKPASTGGAATICSGQSTSITASGGWSGMDSELHWYTGAAGTGTHVGTGTTLSVSPTTTTTYYPRWEPTGLSGTCLPSDDGTAVTVTVNATPPAPADATPAASSTTSITWQWNDVAGETGYRVKDAAGVLKSADLAANTVQWTETTGIVANTQYTRRVYAFTSTCESPGSAGQSRYSLSVPPAGGTVTPGNATPRVNESVVWTATAGFGAGQVQYYRYAWDQNATHTWTESEPQWLSGTITTSPTAGGTWYLHAKGYNGDGVANGAYDYAVSAAATVQADFDADGDVDLTDFATFQSCFNGPNRPIASGCAASDFDGDTDVDLTDFSVFQGCFNGPNRPPACP